MSSDTTTKNVEAVTNITPSISTTATAIFSSTSNSKTAAVANEEKPAVINLQCIIGICAMPKKVKSKPMVQILDRLRATGDFKIIVFESTMFLSDRPVSSWPIVNCLISFYSSGFPLGKAIEYVKLRKPFCVNDLEMQKILINRSSTYHTLEKYGIPTPYHLEVDREPLTREEIAAGITVKPEVEIEEYDDYIVIDGLRMDKPLVEKPFNGDDHNVYIYYAKSQGGGVRRLFRKVKNSSSEFYPNSWKIRRTGSFVYEQFRSAGMDLKVYTIGPRYAHCECRKSPALDGRVERNPDGKEKRLLTQLTDAENFIAYQITQVFKQNICGFDIVRHGNNGYVIDVNGWSFVKGNLRYYDKVARTMRKTFLCSVQGRRAMNIEHAVKDIANYQIPRPFGTNLITDGDNNHVLRSMVTIFRHADRTPKQKIKLKVVDPRLLALFGPPPFKELKWKTYEKQKEIFPLLSSILADVKEEMNALKAKASTEGVDDSDPAEYPPDSYFHSPSTSPVRHHFAPSLHEGEALRAAHEKSLQDIAYPGMCLDDEDDDDEGELLDGGPPFDANCGLRSLFQNELSSLVPEFSMSPNCKRSAFYQLVKKSQFHRLLSQLYDVLMQNYKGTKVQMKAKKTKDGVLIQALLIVKWGGNMTHAGYAQIQSYTPIFWDEMLRPFEQPRLSSDGTGSTEQSLEAMETDEAGCFSDPQYIRQRTNFLMNIQVHASEEQRVKDSARCFLLTTLSPNCLHTGPETIVAPERQKQLIETQLHINDDVQKYLDDTTAAEHYIERAKAHVKNLIVSGVENGGREAIQQIIYMDKLLDESEELFHDDVHTDHHTLVNKIIAKVHAEADAERQEVRRQAELAKITSISGGTLAVPADKMAENKAGGLERNASNSDSTVGPTLGSSSSSATLTSLIKGANLGDSAASIISKLSTTNEKQTAGKGLLHSTSSSPSLDGDLIKWEKQQVLEQADAQAAMGVTVGKGLTRSMTSTSQLDDSDVPPSTPACFALPLSSAVTSTASTPSNASGSTKKNAKGEVNKAKNKFKEAAKKELLKVNQALASGRRVLAAASISTETTAPIWYPNSSNPVPSAMQLTAANLNVLSLEVPATVTPFNTPNSKFMDLPVGDVAARTGNKLSVIAGEELSAGSSIDGTPESKRSTTATPKFSVTVTVAIAEASTMAGSLNENNDDENNGDENNGDEDVEPDGELCILPKFTGSVDAWTYELPVEDAALEASKKALRRKKRKEKEEEEKKRNNITKSGPPTPRGGSIFLGGEAEKEKIMQNLSLVNDSTEKEEKGLKEGKEEIKSPPFVVGGDSQEAEKEKFINQLSVVGDGMGSKEKGADLKENETTPKEKEGKDGKKKDKKKDKKEGEEKDGKDKDKDKEEDEFADDFLFKDSMTSWALRTLRWNGNPLQKLYRLSALINKLINQLDHKIGLIPMAQRAPSTDALPVIPSVASDICDISRSGRASPSLPFPSLPPSFASIDDGIPLISSTPFASSSNLTTELQKTTTQQPQANAKRASVVDAPRIRQLQGEEAVDINESTHSGGSFHNSWKALPDEYDNHPATKKGDFFDYSSAPLPVVVGADANKGPVPKTGMGLKTEISQMNLLAGHDLKAWVPEDIKMTSLLDVAVNTPTTLDVVPAANGTPSPLPVSASSKPMPMPDFSQLTLEEMLELEVKEKEWSVYPENHMMCEKETLKLLRDRWLTLMESFFDKKEGCFDPTKIPDIYDCILYDVLHNQEFLSDIRPLYIAIKTVADFVIPSEYGVLRKHKLAIGQKVVRPLFGQFIKNLEAGLEADPKSRVNIYFSSESHIHALRNVCLLSPLPANRTMSAQLEAIELNYMSHGVLRLYEDPCKPVDHPLRFYVNVAFSPGGSLDPFIFKKPGHIIPISRPVVVNGRVPFQAFKDMFHPDTGSMFQSEPPNDPATSHLTNLRVNTQQ